MNWRDWNCWLGGRELSPPLPLSNRASNPFKLSLGTESEVWQSPALSLWSSPLSFKLLQMCGENGQAACPGRDGWLTECRVLNLPFVYSFLWILHISFPSQTFTQHEDSDSLDWIDCSKSDMAIFALRRIFEPYVFLLCSGQEVKLLISPDVVFFGFRPNALQKERRVWWRM